MHRFLSVILKMHNAHLKRLYHGYMGVYGYRQNGGGAGGVAKSTLFYISFKVGGVIWCPAP